MNYFSHAAVSGWYTRDARSTLGAMLPDLLTMSGLRRCRSNDSGIDWGIALHHATDHWFHADPFFQEALRDQRRELSALGLSRGAAAAAAHVGLELLLDQYLAKQQGTRTDFLLALHLARSQVRKRLVFETSDAEMRFNELLAHLSERGGPRTATTPERTAAQIAWTLAPRPRLRLEPSALGLVAAWAEQARDHYAAEWPCWLTSLATSLGHAGWPQPFPLPRRVHSQSG